MCPDGACVRTFLSKYCRASSSRKSGVSPTPVAGCGREHLGTVHPASELDGWRAPGRDWVDRRNIRTIEPGASAVCPGISAHPIALHPGDVRLGPLRTG